MQLGDECKWYLIKLSDHRFAVQYTGDDAEEALPADLTGCFKAN